ADLMARQALHLPHRLEVPYDFNLQSEAKEYHDLIERCRDAFGANVRWKVAVSRERAIFELANRRDAVEFALICDRPIF
ncbi:MAG TPA: hypothetical protein PLH31_12005, partial [Caulobacter sp.]|nr:hypothetical protein [Caulobacter sp.]